MIKPRLMKTLGIYFSVPFAWVGFAGFAEDFITFQRWFEQGIWVHWTSIKAWLSVILFWYIPEPIFLFAFDYLLIGSVVFRIISAARDPKFNVCDSRLDAVLNAVGCVLIWPICLFYFLHMYFWYGIVAALKVLSKDNYCDDPHIARLEKEHTDANKRVIKQMLWIFLGFIPFLLLISTTLYEMG